MKKSKKQEEWRYFDFVIYSIKIRNRQKVKLTDSIIHHSFKHDVITLYEDDFGFGEGRWGERRTQEIQNKIYARNSKIKKKLKITVTPTNQVKFIWLLVMVKLLKNDLVG